MSGALTVLAGVLFLAHGPCALAENPMIHATGLRAEFTESPIGIDNPRPRLSWVVEAEGRGELQTAFRIQVASAPELLAREEADLWDTTVSTGESSHLVYTGAPLRSHMECFWRVKLWDRDGRSGPWSAVARWSMGILDPSDWVADWIGHDASRDPLESFPAAPAQWIWHRNEGEDPPGPPRCVLARVLEIDSSKSITGVELAVAARDGFRLFVNGREAAASPKGPDAWKRPVLVRDSSLFGPGRNVLYAEAECAGGVAPGFILWLVLRHGDGSQITMGTSSAWRSSDRPVPEWKSGGPGEDEGRPARSFGNFGIAPWRLLDESTLRLPPARYLRGSVSLRKLPTRAVLYASALGVADFYLNGEPVSDERFTPGWTDYERRVYYRAYDVTPLIRQGANVLGAVLADGWFSGYLGWGALRDHYGKKPRILAQLHMEFDDGTTEEFGTGRSWVAGTGAVREADFLMGEKHDAREAHREFFRGDRVSAHPVDLGAELGPAVEAHPGPPVRSFAELRPVAITEPRPEVWVFDLGRNFAGVARLRTREQRGREIVLRFAERLNPDGTVYTDNLRGARAQDSYICAGRGEETWEPRFTFHGFQYVEVTGLSSAPDTGTITGIALSSDTPLAGEFQCSREMLNQLASNILWTQRSNFIDVPTDCPQRDERLGWTGDAQVYSRSACLNVDAQAFFHKWITDLNDAQRSDGQYPMVAPLKVAGSDGGPAWADAGVICPWTVYQIYGDRSILAESYEHMKRFVEFCRLRSPGLLPPEEFHCFGDWLNIQAETPKEVIATAYFAHVSRLLARAAEVLGKTSDAEHYGKLAEEVRAAFQRAYVRDDGTIHGNTQTAYALALSFELLDAADAERAGAHLLKDLEERGGRLSTGFVGTKELMNALSRLGRQDLAYRLLLSEEFPSWGFTIRHGATSIWERWDGWTPERGFQDPQMNSFAHYAFGAVYEWMVATIGGIRPEEPGFGRLVIAPVVDPSLEWARVAYRSVKGLVVSDWRREGRRLKLSVEIPANARCRIVLPMVPGTVTESGIDLERVKDLIIDGGMEAGVAIEAGSGRYEFEGDVLPSSGPH